MPQTETRTALSVWQQLLDTMNATVVEYHSSVVRTPTQVVQLIDGTAVFPGGSGLWRGMAHGGALPKWFPTKPVMFVAHNFDKQLGFMRSLQRRGEASGTFWKALSAICQVADLPLEDCFFTNALMGLQPEKAQGLMPSTPGYLKQCDRFLLEQVLITEPKLIVSLGDHARHRTDLLPSAIPQIAIRHPSALTYVKQENRSSWIASQAGKLAAALK